MMSPKAINHCLDEYFKAIREGNVSKAEKYLKDNPELAQVPYLDGRSPLQLAVLCAWPDVVKVLLTHKADVEQEVMATSLFSGDNVTTPLSDAVYLNQVKIAQILLEHGASVSSAGLLFYAIRWHDRAMIKLLLDYGDDPNAEGKVNSPEDHGSTPLSDARRTDIEILFRRQGAYKNRLIT